MEDHQTKLWTPSFIFACLANFLMGFSFYLLMPTLPFYIVEQFRAGKSVIGIVLSCYVIAALAIRPISGYLVDSFSRKHVYIWSFILFVALYFGYLVAGTLALVVLLRILHGITWGTITTAGNTLAIDIMPSAKRGEGVGYYGLALNISMAIGPFFGLFLYDHYPFAFIFYTAIVSGTLGLIASALIKAPKKNKIHHQPVSLDRFIMVKGIPVGINLILITVSYGMVLSFAAMYGKEIKAQNTGMFYTYMAIGLAASRIFSGRLIDKGKIHMVSLLGLIVLALSFALFTFCQTTIFYFLSALCIGLGYGTLFPAFQTLFINMAFHNQRGTANSTFYTAFDLGVGSGMVIAGKIAEIANLSMAFGFSAFLNAAAILYYWKVSEKNYNRNKVC